MPSNSPQSLQSESKGVKQLSVLAGRIGLCADEARQFCQTERIAHDQIVLL